MVVIVYGLVPLIDWKQPVRFHSLGHLFPFLLCPALAGSYFHQWCSIHFILYLENLILKQFLFVLSALVYFNASVILLSS